MRNEAVDLEDETEKDYMKQFSQILVKPAEVSVENEVKSYESQFKVVEEANKDSNYLQAAHEDDKDSGIGFTLSDFNADFTTDTNEAPKTPEKVYEPKQWTIFSFSPNGQLKVKDEETGEIFTIINEFPIVEESVKDPEDIIKEYDFVEDEEDIGWCSLYLIMRLFGLGLVVAALAGLIIIALP